MSEWTDRVLKEGAKERLIMTIYRLVVLGKPMFIDPKEMADDADTIIASVTQPTPQGLSK